MRECGGGGAAGGCLVVVHAADEAAAGGGAAAEGLPDLRRDGARTGLADVFDSKELTN